MSFLEPEPREPEEKREFLVAGTTIDAWQSRISYSELQHMIRQSCISYLELELHDSAKSNEFLSVGVT
jgi:hypothetical protein